MQRELIFSVINRSQYFVFAFEKTFGELPEKHFISVCRQKTRNLILGRLQIGSKMKRLSENQSQFDLVQRKLPVSTTFDDIYSLKMISSQPYSFIVIRCKTKRSFTYGTFINLNVFNRTHSSISLISLNNRLWLRKFVPW